MAPSTFFAPPSGHMAIFGGTFIQNNVRGGVSRNSELRLLYDGVAPNAILNAGGRADSVRCYKGTREEIIGRIDLWMVSGYKSDRRIFWLSGPAGAGKSAISQTIAELWIKRKVPVATFFFFRADPTRSHARSVVATLLYQIFGLHPEMKDHINSIIKRDPVLLRQPIHVQFRRLIQEPVTAIRRLRPCQPPLVLVIDGLDECGSVSAKEDQRSLIRLLHDLTTLHDSPFIVLVASRPDPHLTMAFNELGTFHGSVLLDETYRPAHDIRRFITGELASIKNTHHLGHSLDKDWPSEAIIISIIDKSSGQFVYAATVVRFIRNSAASPAISMDMVLGLRPMRRISPFAEMDAIYTHILSQAEDWDAVRDLLATHKMLQPRRQSDFVIASTLTDVLSALGYRWDDVVSCMSDLKSIVGLGIEAGYPRVHFYHASLEDFLYNQTRAGSFYINLNIVACRIVVELVRDNQYLLDADLLSLTERFLDYVTEPSDALNEALQDVEFSFLDARDWTSYADRISGLLCRVDELNQNKGVHTSNAGTS